MGRIVRKDSAADNIVEDGKTTLKNANACGGLWKTLVEERLGPLLLLIGTIETTDEANDEVLDKGEAELQVYDGESDDFLGAKADEMWNLVGRPGFDPAYSLVWPGGASAYTDGDDAEQPDRMELLATLLEAGIHPKVDKAWSDALALEVRARATTYRQKLAPVLAARTKAKLLEKAKGILARAVQMELARLKRRFLSEGFSEADIHTVIPDRPRAKPAKLSETPTEPPPPPK